MSIVLVNPLDDTVRPVRKPAARLTSLEGSTVGLLDISKPGGGTYLDRLEQLLQEKFGVARAVRQMKPTFTRPAPGDVLQKFADEACVAVVEALAD